ncbi:glycoside hydrolase family 27 protein [Amycolatopsis sp.]|uniref:glycoside hydrolase family 27 protein n=1 Tax=Amycolatopsis sp. TaxID=37632 RepID=UPI002CD53785|nr:glycoside hydrolase family 27 protein [Amycolatopsis sp.]HVV09771.1 glycoside hydrolase family 27 protein [Amycolatopsis sp.]
MLGRIVLAAVTLAAAMIWPSGPSGELRNGLAATPPMGWNSWNQVGCAGLNEQVVRDAADTLVRTGMRDAGYRYVVVDDCWQALTRAADGSLRPNPDRFPHGMAALADYVHSRGLLFGIYATPGSGTCAMYNSGYPATGIGSLGHERQDAETFASWGVDYLKYDWCYADTHDGLDEQTAFARMRDELQRLPRPILYAISEYGARKPWEWARPVANMWRTTNDLSADWASVSSTIEQQAAVTTGSPGGWNDPDMLQIGNGTLSETEARAHFSIWAILNAPLFTGTSPTAADLGTLLNREVIAVDQDFAGTQGKQLAVDASTDVWGKPLSGGGYAVVLLNRGDSPATVSADVPGRWTVRDLWQHTETGTSDGTLQAEVPAHGAVLLRLTPR